MINTKILIDPGHGIPHAGAKGRIKGIEERVVALRVALILQNWFKAYGHIAYLTRTTDACIVKSDRSADLRARGTMAGRYGAHCLVSIHCNSAADPNANGYECFTLPGQDVSDPLATEMLLAYGRAFPHLRLRADTRDGDIDREMDLLVLKSVSPGIAKCLFELAFLSNKAEEEWLGDPKNYLAIATALGTGICNWGMKMRF